MTTQFHLKPDPNWIRTRRELLEQVKSEVVKRLGVQPPDLEEYSVQYENELKKRWKISSKDELLLEIERADIVYGGDFHAFGQSQRTHMKILRALSGERPVVLALECFSVRSQKWLDRFLAGLISLEELRHRVRWEKEWGFPWENYVPLLELAKRRGFRLLALNSVVRQKTSKELHLRDQKAAEVIREVYVRSPNALIYVIFGDMHLASNHLPKAVRDELNKATRLRDIVVHLNSERIYFQLARKGLELTVDVVRLSRNQFCVLSSPPWLQWQSYLLFLEKTLDESLAGREIEEDGDVFDYTDQVGELIRVASSDLGLKFKADDISVYSIEDDKIWRLLEKNLKAKELEIARRLLSSGRSFFLPQRSLACLSRATVNHAASLAGQYIHARLCGRTRNLWSLPADFPALIWVEAVAYFFSKLINHKRQSATLTDIRARLASTGSAEGAREALKLALDSSLSELVLLRQGRRRPLQIRPRRKASYLEAARILGGMLGERLYLAYRSRKLSREDMLHLFRRDVTGRGFKGDYEEIVRLIGGASGQARASGAFEGIKSRKERL